MQSWMGGGGAAQLVTSEMAEVCKLLCLDMVAPFKILKFPSKHCLFTLSCVNVFVLYLPCPEALSVHPVLC